MLTLPVQPAPLTLDACRAMLAAGRTRVRVRDGHGEAGRRVRIYRIGHDGLSDVVWGEYEIYGVARGGAGMSTTHIGYWKACDLVDDNG
jgi:hypothetical protein